MRLFAILCLWLPLSAAAQNHDHHGAAPSPYADDSGRAIKALSAQAADDLLAGRGMGLARAAELNGYPGPRHVLELADSLALTPEQREAAAALMAEVQAEARPLGAEIVEMERHLDALFAQGRATPDAVNRITAHLASAQGRLRAVHLRAHVAMRDVLTPEQIAAYSRLRGYTD